MLKTESFSYFVKRRSGQVVAGSNEVTSTIDSVSLFSESSTLFPRWINSMIKTLVSSMSGFELDHAGARAWYRPGRTWLQRVEGAG